MSAYGQNIGMARPVEPNAQSRQLTSMFFTMIGTWQGEYSYFDEQAGSYVTGAGSLKFEQAPMPNVLLLDSRTSRPSGPPVHAFSAMVVQSDGSSWRQMAFTATDGRLQDKVITGYAYEDDRNWRVDMLEVQQGLGGVQAVKVEMIIQDGALDMRKLRHVNAEAAERPFESRAQFIRVA